MEKSFKRNNWLIGLLIVIIGLLILSSPEKSIKVIVILLGAFAFLYGIYSLITASKYNTDSKFKLSIVIRSWLSIVVGLLSILLPLVMFNAVQSIVRIVLYLLAIYLLVTACIEIISVIKTTNSTVIKKPFVIEALSSILLAIVLFILPADFGVVLIRIIGAILIVVGIIYTVYEWKHRVIVIEPDSIKDYDTTKPTENSSNSENSTDKTDSSNSTKV